MIKLIITIMAFHTFTVIAENSPRHLMKKGLKSYKEGSYTNAIDYLSKTTQTYPDVGHYNLGIAQFRNQEYAKSSNSFEEAVRSQDLVLQADAYYNHGTALLAQTTKLTNSEDILNAINLTLEAIEQFELSLMLSPNAIDAKQNHEQASKLRILLEFKRGQSLYNEAEQLLIQEQAKLAKLNYNKAEQQFRKILSELDLDHIKSKEYLSLTVDKIEMLKKAVLDAKSDLTQSLKLIQDYQYQLASKILTHPSKERNYAFDINSELKNRYDQTIQKNQQIINIVNDLLNEVNTAK